MARLAVFVYGRPSRKLIVIGVTGTDGKTSTIHMLAHILETAGYPVGYITTAAFKIGETETLNATKQTMPGRFKMQRMLKTMVENKIQYAIIESTSQGMAQSRHLGIDYNTVLFTNLGTDHIEAHGSKIKYRKAKELLFKALERSQVWSGLAQTAVVNLDDPESQHFLKYEAEEKYGYGLKAESWGPEVKKSVNHRVSVSNIEQHNVFGERGNQEIQFTLEFDGEKRQVNAPLVGEFNILNALGAASVALALKINQNAIIKALETLPQIPGRLERIKAGQDFYVFVDYAHAPEALIEIYASLRAAMLPEQKLIAVLGSQGGGRSVSKRSVMGKIAGEKADIVIVTNEDPYDEDPQKIIDDVAEGALAEDKKLDENIFKIEDRRGALEKAMALASPRDVVIVTGKGSETTMAVAKGKFIKWSDKAEIEKMLKQL
ncbi:Mur ligase family protein [Patescibacteria group bacterium]